MNRADARSILLNSQMHTPEEVQEATQIAYPNTSTMRPPRPPPDLTPAAQDTIRYPLMAKQTGKEEQYRAALREVFGDMTIEKKGGDENGE